MASFTTRVELHSATSENYVQLHQAMERAGFCRWVIGTNTTGRHRFALPTAEYDFDGNYTAYEVRDLAKQIADQVKPGAWVLVTEVKDRAWSTAVLAPA